MKTIFWILIYLTILFFSGTGYAKLREKQLDKWECQYGKNPTKYEESLMSKHRMFGFNEDTELEANCPPTAINIISGLQKDRATCPWVYIPRTSQHILSNTKIIDMYPREVNITKCLGRYQLGCCGTMNDDPRYACERIPQWKPVWVREKKCSDMRKKKGRSRKKQNQKPCRAKWKKALVDIGIGCTCVKAKVHVYMGQVT